LIFYSIKRHFKKIACYFYTPDGSKSKNKQFRDLRKGLNLKSPYFFALPRRLSGLSAETEDFSFTTPPLMGGDEGEGVKNILIKYPHPTLPSTSPRPSRGRGVYIVECKS
jgi:hypothetical protein